MSTKITSKNYQELKKIPIAKWVYSLADGESEYSKKSRNTLKNEFFKSRK